jgi:hypothetical protein
MVSETVQAVRFDTFLVDTNKSKISPKTAYLYNLELAPQNNVAGPVKNGQSTHNAAFVYLIESHPCGTMRQGVYVTNKHTSPVTYQTLSISVAVTFTVLQWKMVGWNSIFTLIQQY